jgi:hypothetical protein
MARAAASAPACALSLKITLRGARPPIWRRLIVADSMTLGQLHRAIQAAMGWQDSHMHAFEVDGQTFGARTPEGDFADENRKTLCSLRATRFRYTYDFGDDWEHEVLIEKTVPDADLASLPRCTAGKRACPPEDCGGIWGYEHLRAILADPAHPEHAERLEWLGETLDDDRFDMVEANAALAAAFGR